jgi:hypothetical protein
MVEINERDWVATKNRIYELFLLRRSPNAPALIFGVHNEHLLLLQVQQIALLDHLDRFSSVTSNLSAKLQRATVIHNFSGNWLVVGICACP